VTHELLHGVGLGESSDPNSVMYVALATGLARRSLSAGDLSILHQEGVGTPEWLSVSPAFALWPQGSASLAWQPPTSGLPLTPVVVWSGDSAMTVPATAPEANQDTGLAFFAHSPRPDDDCGAAEWSALEAAIDYAFIEG